MIYAAVLVSGTSLFTPDGSGADDGSTAAKRAIADNSSPAYVKQ
jgi:hypothetical protein